MGESVAVRVRILKHVERTDPDKCPYALEMGIVKHGNWTREREILSRHKTSSEASKAMLEYLRGK